MRRTALRQADDRRELQTDDRGTILLDRAGMVLAEHGTDRHENLLAQHLAEGWRKAEDAHQPPMPVAPLAQRDPGPTGPAATVTDGEDG